MEKQEILMDVKNLYKYFPVKQKITDVLLRKPKKSVKAVDNISLQIRKNEIISLVGESGCGKSSFAPVSYTHLKYMVRSQCDSNAYHMCNHFGIPSMLMEMGGRGLWTREEVEAYKFNVKNVMRYVGLLEGEVILPENPAHVITNAAYIDAEVSGCWYPMVKLEEKVKKGQLLGVIKDLSLIHI